MKFDLHCHTKEGSLDSRVSVSEYVHKFRALGFDGFMIADHNSYRGCKTWDAMSSLQEYGDFCVIRGLEYDTKDAGHMLVIMPDGLYLSVFKIRGMRCRKLIKTVHAFGGILGPAHPFGVKSSSAMGFKKMDMSLIREFDFIETFNTCESPESNRRAEIIAEECGLTAFAGSDAHVPEYIGMAQTEIDADIRCNNDLITAVKDGRAFRALGSERSDTKKARRKEHWVGVLSYKIYNRGIAKLVSPYRKMRHHRLVQKFIRPAEMFIRKRDN